MSVASISGISALSRASLLTVNVEIIPVINFRASVKLSKELKIAYLSSWRSLLYPFRVQK